jgi:hypothetical protein
MQTIETKNHKLTVLIEQDEDGYNLLPFLP